MSERPIQNFQEFWPFYVCEHSQSGCRALHFIGSTLSIVVLVLALVYNYWLLIAVPVVGYGFAWFSHFTIEKNKPASFKYPLWSFIADWKMWALMLAGRMQAEVERSMAQRERAMAETASSH